MSHFLRLEQPDETSTLSGGIDVNWIVIGNVWAEIKPYRTQSQFVAQQDMEETSHIITMRFRHDIASGWRLRKDCRIFEIHWLHDIAEKGQYLACYCKEQGR